MDRHDSAGDNAEPLYRYARTHAPSVRHIFVIERTCPDWDRLAQDGFVLLDPTGPGFDAAWAGAETIILSDIGDPLIKDRLNSAGTGTDQRVVFLQHGVTMRDMWRWFNGSRLDVVVCATAPEQAGLTADHTSYTLTDREVWRTGFPRHDHLYSLLGQDRDRILLAPTWVPEVSRALENDPDAVGLLNELYRPWLELAAGLTQAGHHPLLFAHPKLALNAPEWFRALGVPSVSGRELPETLARSWAVISDRSSVLDEGMLAGCVGIVWDPHGRPDTDHYRARHEAVGAVCADTSEQVYQAVEDVVYGRVVAPEGFILLDAGACARLTKQLQRDMI
jgi:glycosyl transferase family protein